MLKAFLLLPLIAQAAPAIPFATVAALRGHANASVAGKTIELKENLGLEEGTRISVLTDGFVALNLADGSRLNLARDTTAELKNVTHDGMKVSLVHLALGQLRALVKKAKAGKGESLVITTKSAAMGVRGTDFLVSYDPATNSTSLVTVEGTVAMAEWNEGAGNPLVSLAATKRMVAGGQYFVRAEQLDQGHQSAAVSGASAAGSLPAIGAKAASEGKSSTIGDLAQPPPVPATPMEKPGKVPSYFLDTLKKESDAFSRTNTSGEFRLERAPEKK